MLYHRHRRLPSTGQVRGLVKLKKITRSGKNSNCPDPTLPPAYPFFFIFWGETCTTKKTTQKKNVSKKRKSEFGLDPPTHFRVFLGFLEFFKLDKTPYLVDARRERVIKHFKTSGTVVLVSGLAKTRVILILPGPTGQ